MTERSSEPSAAARAVPCKVRALDAHDRRTVVATTARAFAIDPLFDHFTTDLLVAHRSLPAFFAPSIRDLADHGRCWVADQDGRARGIAAWLHPEGYPRGSKRETLLTLRTSPAFVRVHDRVGGLRLFAAVEAAHPKDPHWYLGLLAVDPTLQGKGVGTLLIQPGLDAADEQGLPCYLETQKESNLAWYGRFGFELTKTIKIGDVPPVWCLRRPARER